MRDAPPRLTSAMLVSALIRRVQAEGGFAAVLRRGDDGAGAILVECVQGGERRLMLERATGPDGRDAWRLLPEASSAADHAEKLNRRIRSDPDLWIVELDIAQAERFAAETIGSA